ncbi:MAG: insulinase family protein [Thermoanaerobaculia bacterium]|nr:insulinase family protein [Thermoanaerobaculia bacterium]
MAPSDYLEDLMALIARLARVRFAVLTLSMILATAGVGWGQESYQTVVLDNGLTLLLSPNDAHPVIALSMFVTTGGRTEDEYYQGSLHYIEHLIFKGGTPNLAPTEFRKRMSTLGQESGGWTWDDEINFGFEVPKEAFPEAWTVFREALLDLEFEEQWFEDEKRVVLQEMEKGRERPSDMLWEAWDALAFTEHPYGRSVIGTEKAINDLEMTRTELYYRDRFSPNHIILSIAGDFEVEAMVEAMKTTWGKLPRGPESFELGRDEPPQRGPRSREEYVEQATSGRILSGVVGPPGSSEDTSALVVLAALLENSSVGLGQYLIEQEKWVNWLSVSHYPMHDASMFQVAAEMMPEKTVAVRQFVHQFLSDFDATKVSPDVFEEVRRGILLSEARQRETFSDTAGRLGFLTSRLGEVGARNYLQRLAEVTPAEVQAAKKRWILPRRYVTSTVLPEDFAAPETEKQVQVAKPRQTVTPDLRVAGALLPPGGSYLPLTFELTSSEGGVSLFTYANGLRLVVRPSQASRLLAVSGRIVGGQWVEGEDQAGINRMLAELGMRRTRRWDSEGFSRLQGSLSLSASAHAPSGSRANTSRNVDYRDAAGHHVQGLVDQWPEALALLKETLYFVDFDSAEVEKVRQDLLSEIQTLPEDNLEYIKQEFYRRTYAGHPYGRPTVGTEESIGKISAADLAAFHKAQWTPNRTVVTLVGDVDPSAVARWVSTHWSDLPSTQAAPILPTDVADWKPSPERQVLALGKDQWTVNWGRPGAAAGDDDEMTSRVLSLMAGNDHFYKYVYGEGVSYRSWIKFWSHLGPGAWILENDVQRERFDAVLDLFEEDLIRYRGLAFEDEEFDRARARLLNGFVLGAQSNASLAWSLAVAEGNDVGYEEYLATPERVEAVTRDQLKALAMEIFDPQGILRLQQQ